MSALRLSRPGEPTLLVDLGPAVGRRTPGWSGRTFAYGGTFVQGESDKARQRRVAAEWKKANPELARERQNAWYAANREKALESQRQRRRRHMGDPLCDARMPLHGDRCARTPGHGGEHRSAFAMDNALARKANGRS